MSDSFTWWGGLSWVRLGEASLGLRLSSSGCWSVATLLEVLPCTRQRERIPVSLVSFQHGGFYLSNIANI